MAFYIVDGGSTELEHHQLLILILLSQIEDAMALWEKLKTQKADEAWKPEQEEEFEDSQGNVVNKKIYEDLKRQGLL